MFRIFMVAITFQMACWGNFVVSQRVINPCEKVSGWRASVCQFSKAHLIHFAWGYEHSIRDYQLAMKLASEEGIQVDEEVLFAASLLHDLGGFPPFEKEGADHAIRSTQVIEPILKESGFPLEKSDAVKMAIITHSYYDPNPPQSAEAVVLHDADTLDFLGAISMVRILSIAGKEKGIPDPKSAINLLTKFQGDLTSKLYGGTFTKEIGRTRAAELKHFLQLVEEETFSLGTQLRH